MHHQFLNKFYVKSKNRVGVIISNHFRKKLNQYQKWANLRGAQLKVNFWKLKLDDPGVFTELIKQLGVKGVEMQEIVELDNIDFVKSLK